MKRGYPVSKGILVQMRLFIHVFRILFTIIHSNTYLEKGLKRKELTNMKTAVVYWSGTGNTEAMARAVAEGMTAAGAEAVLLTPAEVAPGDLNAYAAIAFGCPAMGAEVLEEMEFQPMFDACKRSLGGKRVALFGSYGWGDGEWMRTWESDCDSAGVNLVCESVICTETPDDAALEACRALGKALAE